jgi:hypothetical protein
MSIKIERDVIRESVRPEAGALISKALSTAAATPAEHASDVVKHADQLADSVGDFVESVGESLTGGPTPAAIRGPKGYLMAYIRELENNPLRTKMLTAGVLSGAQELAASWLAKDIGKHGGYLTPRVPKMAAYGAFVSAPLGHILIWCLQRAFRGRTSVKAKVTQILVSNLVMAPIQNAVYLVAMALIAGARTRQQIRATVKVGFWKVMKVSWLTSPLCLAFAQKFLPEHLWVPFFNLVAFTIGTYINTLTKKKRLAALRKKHFGEPRSTSARGDHRDLRDSRDSRDSHDPRDLRDSRDSRGVAGGRAETAASGPDHPGYASNSQIGGHNQPY